MTGGAMGVRKSQVGLTAEERARYVAAVLQLKANGRYDEYVEEHHTAMMTTGGPAHQRSTFLPWHREYLRRFELDLQQIDLSVTIPYWNWLTGRQAGESPWIDDFIGGTGQGASRRVESGPFAFARGQWTITVTSPGDTSPALRRTLGSPLALPRAADISAALGQIPYDSSPWDPMSLGFRSYLERVIHNPVHGWVGGSMAMMTSPNDPVFFLHHCNVDRLWARWQDQHPTLAPYLPTTGGLAGTNLDDPMAPWGGTTTPRSVLNHRTLGYTYDDDPAPDGDGDGDAGEMIVVGAPALQRGIGQAGEVDRYRFVAPSAGTYTLETTGPTDVVMTLFGPNDPNAQVTEDDDSGQDRNARIQSNLSAGTYFVRVRHFRPTSTGNYGISVPTTPGQMPIPQIQVNGPTAQGEIAPANESDLYTFTANAPAALYTVETTGSTDTFITLFGPNSQTTRVAEDDDSGLGVLSRIRADLRGGVYFVRVRHYDPTGTGAYGVRVTR